MKFVFKIPKQEQYMIDLMKADFNHLQKVTKKNMIETARRFQNDRDVRVKLYNLIKRFIPAIQIGELEAKYFSEVDMFKFNILEPVDNVILEVEIDDNYYQILSNLPKGLVSIIGESPKAFKEKIIKSLVTEYKIKESDIQMVENYIIWN